MTTFNLNQPPPPSEPQPADNMPTSASGGTITLSQRQWNDLMDRLTTAEATAAKPKPSAASGIMTTIFTHWKSTANGVLALFITTGLVLLATGSTLLSPKMTVYITIGLAVARAWTGLIS